jgi:hypothetical protein
MPGFNFANCYQVLFFLILITLVLLDFNVCYYNKCEMIFRRHFNMAAPDDQ